MIKHINLCLNCLLFITLFLYYRKFNWNGILLLVVDVDGNFYGSFGVMRTRLRGIVRFCVGFMGIRVRLGIISAFSYSYYYTNIGTVLLFLGTPIISLYPLTTQSPSLSSQSNPPQFQPINQTFSPTHDRPSLSK